MALWAVEKKYREIKEIYPTLAENAYPYQKQEILESSMCWYDLLKTHTKIRFFAVYEGGTAVLIAPLRVFKNGVKVLGTLEKYNMSDFVYNTDDCILLSNAILTLLNYLKEKVFANKAFEIDWCYLYEKSLSLEALHKLSGEGSILSFSPVAVNNIQIPIKDTYDAYFKGLSKHSRQNVRTAYNRIYRENHDLSVHFYQMGAGGEIKREGLEASKKYSDISMKRLAERYQKKGLRFFVKKVLSEFNAGKEKTLVMASTMSTPFTLLADITIDNEVAAYAKCYMDLPHKMVTVPSLAIDIDYGFYSPGIILVNELVKYLFQMGDIEYLSMGRGEEPYKFEMGGEFYYTYNCTFIFP